MAISSALKQVCRPKNLFEIRISVLLGCRYRISFFFFQCPSLAFVDGINEPSGSNCIMYYFNVLFIS